MQKFYKYFSWTVLALAAAVFSSTIVSSQTARETSDEENNRCQAQQQVYVVENTPKRTIHLVYDFERGTVSQVQIRERDAGFGNMQKELVIESKRLGQ